MNKKTTALLLLLVLITGLCFLLARTGANSAVLCISEDGGLAIRMKRGAYEETVRAFFSEQDGTWMFFLPSGKSDRKIHNGILNASLSVDGRKLNFQESFEWEEEKPYAVRLNNEDITVKFLSSSGVPAVFIKTEPGGLDMLKAGKQNTVRGTITVFDAEGNASYRGKLTLKGRGNSTWFLFDKKPFNIKLDKAGSLLGMERDKDWCLLANAWDYSYMNNMLALDMAKNAGFRFVPDAEYADLWINGDYRGLYLLTEKVEVDKERVDITDLKTKNLLANPGTDPASAETYDIGSRRGIRLANLPEDITGGYMIERDYRLDPDYPNRLMTPSYFETDDFGTAFNIKFPEYADEKEVEYISGLTNEMEQAIRSEDGVSETGKSWLDYLDLTSWVRSYMVAEIACDMDKDVTNTYYYKDTDRIDSKFYLGPVWDYDNRFGGHEGDPSPETLTRLDPDGWSRCLYEKPEFYEAVCEEWMGFFRNYLNSTASVRIDEWQKRIFNSVQMDLLRWPRGEGYPVKWPIDDGSFTAEYSFEDEVNHLKSWLTIRTVFLDSIWGNFPTWPGANGEDTGN